MFVKLSRSHGIIDNLGSRHTQALLLFLGMATAFALRVCMSVAIVAMKNKDSANPDFPVSVILFV